MKGNSCLTDLISFCDKVTWLVDEQKAVNEVFLDFSQVFDALPHSILLDKLSSCQVSRYTECLVKNRLKGRAQSVLMNGLTSGLQLVTSGAPQGAVLKTVLFSMSINNLDVSLLVISNWEVFSQGTSTALRLLWFGFVMNTVLKTPMF